MGEPLHEIATQRRDAETTPVIPNEKITTSPSPTILEKTDNRAWQRLRPGDKVLVVGSSWPISWDREEREQYIKLIRELIEGQLGLVAVIPDSLLQEPFNDHYINNAQTRAANEIIASKDSDIKLIWNLHGGYGALESGKILDDWRKKHPDALKNGIPEVGFSDITIKILRKGQPYTTLDKEGKPVLVSGITSPIHGPTLMHVLPKPAGIPEDSKRRESRALHIQHFKELFMEGYSSDGVKTHETKNHCHYNIVGLNNAAYEPGKIIKGQSLGGHTNRITASFGTEWEVGKNHSGIDNDKIILTIESDDVPEVEQFFRHIKNTSVWSKISAIVIGHVVPLAYRFGKEHTEFYDSQTRETLKAIAAKCDKPVFGQLSIGHTLHNEFLPMLTDGQIVISKSGQNAQLQVNTFRNKKDIETVPPFFNPSPEAKFPRARKEYLKQPTRRIAPVDDIKLTPINNAARATKAISAIDIIGGDIGEEQNLLGTPMQLDTKDKVVFFHADLRRATKILTLAGDDSSPPHFSSLVKADMVRFLAHMNEAGIFKNAHALIIGDVITPSGAAQKSLDYLREFNKQLEIFLTENNITLPVYRAEGHEYLPRRFEMKGMHIERIGVDNKSKLTTEKLIEQKHGKPEKVTFYLGEA